MKSATPAGHANAIARSVAQRLFQHLPVAALLLDNTLTPICLTPLAKETCARWWKNSSARGSADTVWKIPREIVGECHSLRASQSSEAICVRLDVERASKDEIRFEKPCWVATIALLPTDTQPADEALFLVRLEDHREVTPPFTNLDRLFRLSACEREVALLVGQGCSNEEVARHLGKSALTVKKQLRSIFQKLRVSSRVRLCAMMR